MKVLRVVKMASKSDNYTLLFATQMKGSQLLCVYPSESAPRDDVRMKRRHVRFIDAEKGLKKVFVLVKIPDGGDPPEYAIAETREGAIVAIARIHLIGSNTQLKAARNCWMQDTYQTQRTAFGMCPASNNSLLL